MNTKQRVTELMKIAFIIVIPAIFLLFTYYAVINQDLNLSRTFDSKDSKASTGSTLLAFPGVEGFGAQTIGGRGGKVYEVTNINDSGEGSLRNCVIDAKGYGARTCIFKVGGTITLNSALSLNKPYITIAGQTAPGGGILLRAASGFTGDLMNVSTHDVIIRYLTFRRGPPSVKADTNNLSFYKYNSDEVYNFVVDHCSFSWATDRLFFTWYGARDFSVQWNLFTEPLDCSTNSKTTDLNTCHSKALMFGSYSINDSTTNPVSKNVSYHHNLVTNSHDRNPLIKTTGITDIVNNVNYNTGNAFSTVDLEHQIATIPVNYINNYFKVGPNTKSTAPGIKIDNAADSNVIPPMPRAQIFQQDNIRKTISGSTLTGSAFVEAEGQPFIISTRFAAPAITETSAEAALPKVLEESGNYRGINANGAWVLRRDAVDKRIVNETNSGKGKIIDAPWSNTCFGFCRGAGYYLTANDYVYPNISPSEINQTDGWPNIVSGEAYPDDDHDGISNSWEIAHSLDPNNASDANNVALSGYTWLEEFINGSTTPPALPTPTPILVATTVPVLTNTPPPTSLPTSTPAILITPTPTPKPTIAPSRIPSSTQSPTQSPTRALILPSSTPIQAPSVMIPTPTKTPSPVLLSPIMGEYFSNQTLSGNPVFFRYDDTVNFNWGYGSPDKSIPKNRFSVRWTKQQHFDTGKYTFNVVGDDGVRIYYDNILVYNRWRSHYWTTKNSFRLSAQEGNHTIRIEYFENYGKAKVSVSLIKN